ncbi:MAG TPA: hypothetical protein VGV09_13650 [Steroidobacteraceae bacterium]|nr:hypothetical protein [Steroidobacteraceae bacterium]
MTRRILCAALLLAALVGNQAVAQQVLSGPWQGKLAVDAKTTLTIQFTFSKRPDGGYAAVVDSPDNPAIKNMAASSVSFNGNELKVNVAALSGSYVGTLKDGKFDGHWTQPGGVLPLVLSAYQKPQLSKAAISTLVGAWHGPIPVPGPSVTFLIRFKVNDKGELAGTLSVPEQPERGEPALTDIAFTDNTLEFKVGAPGGAFTYHGTFANGVFTGTWHQAGTPLPGMAINLKRGDVASTVYILKMTAPEFATVAGSWSGKLTGPRGAITIVVRFEVNAAGQYVGFIDSPDQGVKGIPIADAKLAAGKLTLKMNVPPAQFEGTLAGKSIAGQWLQGPPGQPPMPIPLTLMRQ